MNDTFSPRLKLAHTLANAVLFQACWFAAILLDWYWALPGLVLLLWQAWAGKRVLRWWPLAGIALVGIAADTTLLNLGVYNFSQARLSLPGGEPLWMAMLWLGFALTLPYSLDWLVQKRRWFVVTCALVGPLSYSAGMRLGVMDFGWTALPVIAALWVGVGLLVLYLIE